MSLANFGEPVTLVRSPTFTKLVSGRIVRASKPLKRVYGSTLGGMRGAQSRTAAAIARMCAGVEPQQPPTIFNQPLEANSRKSDAMMCGVSSKPPKALGKPALG